MRRRRYSSYSSYRRRRFSFASVFRVIVILAALAAILCAGYMVRKAILSDGVIADLEAENAALRQQVAQLQEIVPDVTFAKDMQAQSLAYQSLYPEMQVEPTPAFEAPKANTVYLTFDDGPSANTAAVLDALKASGQKATFFLIGRNIPGNEALVKRMADEGHTIGVHTYSHDYNAIYASVEAYLEDFNKTYEAIYAAAGVYPTVFRFPGGSINSYSRQVYQPIIAEMLRRGFVYYDWSVSSADATGSRYTAQQVQQNVMAGIPKTTNPIVLLHDGVDKKQTAAAMPGLVQQLTAAGYTCAPLTNTVRPVNFNYSE